MKAAVLAVTLLSLVAVIVWNIATSSTAPFDPTAQGIEARTTAAECTTWTELLNRVGPPSKWRDSTGEFAFDYSVRFEESTPGLIAEMLERSELSRGFSFFYRFSDAVTFVVNFNRTGELINIRDKEGMGDLMDAAGG
ncbi:MAG: hypothetical protein JSU63_06425 [Phycisphaerales bacterium]|nr:MAG: hypothetical protein JSU63_06425 [Phycisphaerales bacterium]